jgi:hypothetical protein
MNAAFMRLGRHERGIHVIEKPARPGSGVTGGRERPCGTTGTAVTQRRQSLTVSHAPAGTSSLRTPGPRAGLIVTIDPVTTDPCDHRHEANGHDAGARLRHLSQIRHATCISPVCRRPAAQCDLEHNTPYEAGGRTCLCNTGPPCSVNNTDLSLSANVKRRQSGGYARCATRY